MTTENVPACLVKVGSSGLSYETTTIPLSLSPPVGDGVYTADGSPQIGTFLWNKPRDTDGFMEITYQLVMNSSDKFVDIPNTHNISIAVNSAFTVWGLFGNIRFVRVPQTSSIMPDITIKFDGSDPMFAPPSGQTISSTMAYTYYPNMTPSGKFTSVYNSNYLWSLDGKFNFAYNINETLRHELGHSIGMVHTTNPDDIMYPFYHNANNPTSMDIYQVQFMYGIRNISQWKIDAFFELDKLEEEFIT